MIKHPLSYFQPQPTELPSLLRVPAPQPPGPGGEQQPVGVPARGDRPLGVPDGAGRLLQRDHPPPGADRGPRRTQESGSEEESPTGGASR